MYIIKCQEDGSFCMVENEDVICDENVVEIGDCVPFMWNSKRFKLLSGKLLSVQVSKYCLFIITLKCILLLSQYSDKWRE